jgi:hypothetical protein
MADTQLSESTTSRAFRLSFWGLTIVGFLGLILAITATQDGGHVGAAISLAASALAFGTIGFLYSRR